MSAASEERLFAPDLIRALAIVLVVALHATDSLLRAPGLEGWLNNGLNATTRIAVPLFVMLSGWLIGRAPAPASALDFLRKRLPRVLIPLLVWSFVYIGWRIAQGDTKGLRYWVGALASSDVYYHLWFLYLMVALYCITPFILPVLRQPDRTLLPIFFILWVLTYLIPPVLSRGFGVTYWLYLSGMPVDYLGYFVFGLWLAQRPTFPFSARLCLMAWLGGWVWTVLGTWLATPPGASLSHLWHYNMRPNIILMSFAAFAWLHPWGSALTPTPRVRWLVARVAQVSLGIYLMHPLFFELCAAGRLGKLGLFLTATNAAARLSLVIVAVLICGLVAHGIARFKFLRPLVS